MSHLKIIYSGGYQDAMVPVSSELLALTPREFRTHVDILSLKKGIWVTLDNDGSVTLPEAGEAVIGVLLSDTEGRDFDNLPAYASGLVGVNIGTALIETDQVEESNLKPGEVLYVSQLGKLTRATGEVPLGIVKEGNSPTNKTITFYKS